mmetsp:Transcript_9066/g.26009  ORF Transcript_9066/g.26009 Transcript_9066/m.26009 type:complete len:97 (-) Transcript_9066:8-298(-)
MSQKGCEAQAGARWQSMCLYIARAPRAIAKFAPLKLTGSTNASGLAQQRMCFGRAGQRACASECAGAMQRRLQAVKTAWLKAVELIVESTACQTHV